VVYILIFALCILTIACGLEQLYSFKKQNRTMFLAGILLIVGSICFGIGTFWASLKISFDFRFLFPCLVGMALLYGGICLSIHELKEIRKVDGDLE